MIEYYLGIDSDYILLGVAGLTLLIFLFFIINVVQMYYLTSTNEKNQADIKKIEDNLRITFQKVGLVKYDAFQEMGGKLSFSLALLNKANDGFIINAMHSREGCYTYIKEIIDGNSVIALAEEEKEALDMAIYYNLKA